MICINCGATNPEEAVFCQRCGKRLETTSSDAFPTLSSLTISPASKATLELSEQQDEGDANLGVRGQPQTDLTKHAELPVSPYKSSPYTAYGESEAIYPPSPPSVPFESTLNTFKQRPPLRTQSNTKYLIIIVILVTMLVGAVFFELGQLVKGNSQGVTGNIPGNSNQSGRIPTNNGTSTVTIPTPTPTPTNTPTPTPTNTPTPTPSISTFHLTLDAAQDVPGLDTGINVPSGSHLSITASGEAYYGSDSLGNCVGNPSTNPDGQRMLNGSPCPLRYGSDALLPSAPIGELLASFGQSGNWFAVGSNYSTTVTTGGRLFLIYNDGYHGDNSGSYQVTVTVTS